MRAGVMSAGVSWRAKAASTKAEPQEFSPRLEALRPVAGWNPERFATEQMRSLVRQVFSPSVTPAVRQVVLSSVESETEVGGICTRLGEVLAAETSGDVAVVAGSLESDGGLSQRYSDGVWVPTPRQMGTQLRRNLWMVPLKVGGEPDGTTSLHRHLGEIRRDFEYSIVAAAPCSESNEAIVTAQFGDGLILVLSAQYTRRIAAIRIREAIDSARVRFLGTVLSDREFPIPEGIYRRL